jgi:NAD(P)-dependent dehydrogenase (short-subunit alcohol dehydrogenase family)
MKLKPINQQIVVVVGCTSGIGLETARGFAREGAMLVLAGRGQSDLEATLAAVREEGSDGITVEADVANFDQVKNIAQRAIDTYGRIDTWAHIAGTPLYSKVENTDPDDFRRVLDVNLNGPMHGILAALPHLKREGRGALIIVSSVDARVPLPYQGPYVASKQGLQGLIDTLRIELKHDGYPISVTNIKPATISTPFFEKAKTNLGFEPGLMPPIYSAKSVADAIIYAAQHPVRTMNVGGASTLFQVSRRLSPAMTDAVIQRIAFKGQQTNVHKGPDAPNNLWQHVEGYNRSEGKLPGMYSKATWLQTHPAARWAVRILLLVGLPIGVAALIRSRRKPVSLPVRAGWTVSNALTDLASAGVITSLISRFQPRKAGFGQRIRRGAQDVLATAKDRAAMIRETMPSRKQTVGQIREAIPAARESVTHLRESLPSAKETISRVRETLPSLPRRKQSMPEKLMSKVQDIMPKGMFAPERKSIPERAIDNIKEMELKNPFKKQRRSFPARLVKRIREIPEEILER